MQTPESTLRCFLRDTQNEADEIPLFGLPMEMDPAETAAIQQRLAVAQAEVAAIVQLAEEKLQKRKNAPDGKEILTGTYMRL